MKIVKRINGATVICPFGCDVIMTDTDRVEVRPDGYQVTIHGVTFSFTDSQLHAWADAFLAARGEYLEQVFEAEAL